MMNPRTCNSTVFLLALSAMLVVAAGCASSQPKTVPTVTMLEVVHHVGGTHHRALAVGGQWFQTFSNRLLVVNPVSALVLYDLTLAPFGTTGPAVDLAASGSNIAVVLDGDEVVMVLAVEGLAPSVASRLTAAELGVHPRHVVSVAGEFYVSGEGGVVRLSDKVRFLANYDAGPVAMTAEGLAADVGRQIRRIEDGRFIGAASEIRPIEPGAGAAGLLLFTWVGESGASAGVMSPAVREIDRAAVRGTLRNIRATADRIWLISDEEVVGYRFADDKLTDPLRLSVRGGRDVIGLRPNYVAVVGVFGRSIYRINEDNDGPGNTFAVMVREASGLQRAVTDNRRILAGSDLGAWMYVIENRVEQVDRLSEKMPGSPTADVVNTGRATIAADGKVVTFATRLGDMPYTEPGVTRFETVAAVTGEIWIGHDRGISVVTIDETGEPQLQGTLRIEGPVRYIYPLLAGEGASYVSEFGGFGVARFVARPIPAK